MRSASALVRLVTVATIAGVAGAAACTFSGNDGLEPKPASSASSGGDASAAPSTSASGTGTGTGDGEDAGGDAAPNYPCASPTTLHLSVEADTGPATSECNGSITRGTYTFITIGAATYLARFTINPADLATMQSETLVGGALNLAADVFCVECGDAGLPSKAGTLTMWVLRSDWDEGDGGKSVGADSCRRTTSGRGWGTASTAGSGSHIAPNADYAGPFGSTTVADGALTVSIPIDVANAPAAFAAVNALDGDTADTSLAVFVAMTSGGRFITTTKESKLPTKPKLDLVYCPK